MSDQDECKHGMVPAWCAACRGLVDESYSSAHIDYTFEAKYAGKCAGCGKPFAEGVTVGKTTDGDIIDKRCFPDDFSG